MGIYNITTTLHWHSDIWRCLFFLALFVVFVECRYGEVKMASSVCARVGCQATGRAVRRELLRRRGEPGGRNSSARVSECPLKRCETHLRLLKNITLIMLYNADMYNYILISHFAFTITENVKNKSSRKRIFM